jgi:hypothetical protein
VAIIALPAAEGRAAPPQQRVELLADFHTRCVDG